jgi:hypothetical protein
MGCSPEKAAAHLITTQILTISNNPPPIKLMVNQQH